MTQNELLPILAGISLIALILVGTVVVVLRPSDTPPPKP